jgi:hypothetical protein
LADLPPPPPRIWIWIRIRIRIKILSWIRYLHCRCRRSWHTAYIHMSNRRFLLAKMSITFSSSVADPGCLSRIPDPDFFLSRIPDLGSRIQKQQQKRGVKKFFSNSFLCNHKFHKIENYFTFEVLKKKIWANFQRIIELFTQKVVTKLSKIWVLGSGIRKKPILDPGSRIQGSKRHRIPDPEHCFPGSCRLKDCFIYIMTRGKNYQVAGKQTCSFFLLPTASSFLITSLGRG